MTLINLAYGPHSIPERPLDPPESELTMTQDRHIDLIVGVRQAELAKDVLGHGSLPGDPEAVRKMMDEYGDDHSGSLVAQVVPLIGADSDDVTPEEALRRYHLIAKAAKGWLTHYWDIAVDRDEVAISLYPEWL